MPQATPASRVRLQSQRPRSTAMYGRPEGRTTFGTLGATLANRPARTAGPRNRILNRAQFRLVWAAMATARHGTASASRRRPTRHAVER